MLSVSPSTIAPFATPYYQSPYVIVVLLYFASPVLARLLDLSIPITSPSLVYTPFVCNSTEVSFDPTVCQGGWQISADNSRVSATASSNPIRPQIFLRFRASSVCLTPSPDSNATVEIIVAWESITRRSSFDSSMGYIAIMDLPDDSTFILTITVNPSTSPTLFGLTTIIITTPPDVAISSVLPPTITLSSAISPTVFTTQSANPNTSITTTPSQSSSQKLSPQTIKLAIGLSVGLGVGLTLLAALSYWLFRRHRKAQTRDRRWSFVT